MRPIDGERTELEGIGLFSTAIRCIENVALDVGATQLVIYDVVSNRLTSILEAKGWARQTMVPKPFSLVDVPPHSRGATTQTARIT